MSIWVEAERALVTAGYDGLVIWDIKDLKNPFPIGSFRPGQQLTDIFCRSNIAYISAEIGFRERRMHLFDVSDPARISRLGSVSFAGMLKAASGNIGYVLSPEEGLHVIDLTNPTAPSILATYSPPRRPFTAYEGDVELIESRGLAVISFRHFGVHLLDVANPAKPALIAADNARSEDSCLNGDSLFFANYHEWKVLNTANDSTTGILPTVVHRQSWNWRFYSVAVTGNLALFGASTAVPSWGGLHAFDITNLTEPVEVGFLGPISISSGNQLKVKGTNIVFVAGNFSGFDIVDISEPSRPERLAYTSGRTFRIVLLANHALVSDDNGTVQVIDITKPSKPEKKAAYTYLSSGSISAMKGGLAFISGRKSLEIADFTDPEQPRRIKTYKSTELFEISDLQVDGTLAYTASPNGLRIIDISDLRNIRPISLSGSFGPNVFANRITLSGSFVILVDLEGLKVVDVKNPYEPKWTGTFNDSRVRNVAVVGSHVFATGESGLHIFRMDPTGRLNRISGLSYVGTGALALVQNFALVADSANNLLVVDVSEIARPRVTDVYKTPAIVRAVTIRDGLAFVANDFAGMQILDISHLHNPFLKIERLKDQVRISAAHRSGSRVFIERRTALGRWEAAGNVLLTNNVQTVMEFVPPGSGSEFFRARE